MRIPESFYTTFAHEFDISQFEGVACNLCGSDNYRAIGEEHSFTICQCLDCGLVYVNPQPITEDLPRIYEDMYTDTSDAEMEARHFEYGPRHVRRILQRRVPGGGRLLEVGCGSGRLLEALRGLPFDLHALELSESAAAHARARVPEATIDVGGVDTAEFPDGQFDAIVSVAVLEHLKDPKAAFATLTRWLAPGGLLIVQLPYIANFIRLKRWVPALPVYFEAPRHLFDFSPRTLRRYFSEQGLADAEIEISRPYSANGLVGLGMIWAVKAPGIVLHALTGGRYVYPFAAATIGHARKV